MCFQVRAVSSLHWIYIHFCVWLGLFVDRWWLKDVRYAPDFLSNCSTCVPLAAPGITRSLSKRIYRGTHSQKKPKIDPSAMVSHLLRKQDVLMLKFMVNLVVLSPQSQRSTETAMAIAVPSIFWRYEAKPQKQSVRLSSFAKKTNEEVSGWYHVSKYWLFAISTRFFLLVPCV